MRVRDVFIAGGAIFAMFFGAGNIVFPIGLGNYFPSDWYSAIFGFCTTGVIVPLLGLISIVFLNADSDRFFAPLDRNFIAKNTVLKFSILIQVVLMLIEGPFGIVPRALTVGFSGVKAMCPGFSPIIFFGLSCLFLFFLTKRKEKIVPIIGKVLTPIKLSLLFVLVIFGLYESFSFSSEDITFSMDAFFNGAVTGYQTYDLPGAIYFASIVMGYFYMARDNNGLSDKRFITKAVCACFISAFLLTIMYFAFAYISAHYVEELRGMSQVDMLPKLVELALGGYSKILFCAIMVVACLTTSVAALSVWSRFIDKFVEKYNISHTIVISVSLVITFFISNLGFDGIVANMEPVLVILYPLLILLTVYNLCKSFFGVSKNEN